MHAHIRVLSRASQICIRKSTENPVEIKAERAILLSYEMLPRMHAILFIFVLKYQADIITTIRLVSNGYDTL